MAFLKKYKILQNHHPAFLSNGVINLEQEKGFGLVEILVASGIITVVAVGVLSASQLSLRLVRNSTLEGSASFLSEEGIEAVRIMRDAGWSAKIAPLISSTTYYPIFNTGAWTLTTTNPGLIDGVFSRTVIFDDAYRRNSDDDIVDISSSDSKTLDAGTRKVTVRVSWDFPAKQVELVTYITNLFQN